MERPATAAAGKVREETPNEGSATIIGIDTDRKGVMAAPIPRGIPDDGAHRTASNWLANGSLSSTGQPAASSQSAPP